jgi:hypothetical protein
MIEQIGARAEAGFDVAQTFTIRELRKRDAKELVATGEATNFVVALVTVDQTMEFIVRHSPDELGEDQLFGVPFSTLAQSVLREIEEWRSSREQSLTAVPPCVCTASMHLLSLDDRTPVTAHHFAKFGLSFQCMSITNTC